MIVCTKILKIPKLGKQKTCIGEGLGLWCLMPLSIISWWIVLLVEETGVPGQNHRSVASH